jgi:hypothetical protein
MDRVGCYSPTSLLLTMDKVRVLLLTEKPTLAPGGAEKMSTA